jgi:membrane protein implicated in regulation of membrane protease activity
MTGRLIIAIISTCLEETAIAAGILWGLPRLGVRLPLWGLIAIMVPVMLVWLAYSVFTYKKGTIALSTAQPVGVADMIGTEGTVTVALSPEGMVRIRGELWVAKTAEGEILPGTEVIVVGQERLKLVVKDK